MKKNKKKKCAKPGQTIELQTNVVYIKSLNPNISGAILARVEGVFLWRKKKHPEFKRMHLLISFQAQFNDNFNYVENANVIDKGKFLFSKSSESAAHRQQ